MAFLLLGYILIMTYICHKELMLINRYYAYKSFI